MGSIVGSVSETKLAYSPITGHMSIDAIIAIEPDRIQVANGQRWTNRRQQTDNMMNGL
jgi:hypothetical protein